MIKRSSAEDGGKQPRHQLLDGGMSGDLIRTHDWSGTSLGSPEEWPVELIVSLNLVLNSQFPMFLAWGLDGLLFYNDAYLPAIAGKGDCIGRPFLDVFEEARLGIEPLFERAMRGTPLYVEEFQVPLVRHGRLAATWWTASYSPILIHDGSVGGILGVVHETTRRLLAEQALASSEAALRAVTDTAPTLLWRCGPDGRLSWGNKRLTELFGGDLSTSFWDDRVHPDDIVTGHRVHDDCARSGRPFECQQRIRGADDAVRWHTVRAQQVVDGSGKIMGWLGSAVDIDDWRSALDAAQARDDLFRAYSMSASTLKWIADVEAQTAETLNHPTGTWPSPVGAGPVSWRAWLALVHPDDEPKVDVLFRKAIGGEVAQAAVRGLPARGVVRTYQHTVFPIADESGRVHRLGGLTLDVTSDIPLRIYLVDADPIHRHKAIRDLSQMHARVRAFDHAAAFENVIDDLLPGCVVLAARPDDVEETLRVAALLRHTRGRLPWIATGELSSDVELAIRFMKLGACDVVDESKGPAAVLTAVSAALSATPEAAPQSDPAAVARKRLNALSERERQVLAGLVSGLTNKEIAIKLSLSPRTVETHRAHLMDRSGAETLADLLQMAVLAGETARDL